MKTNFTKTLLATAATAVLFAAPALQAHEETVKPGAGCSRHHVAANASFEKGMALLDQAKAAGAAQKDQLLTQASQELKAAKGHMDQCAKECGTMNHDEMHGGHGAAAGGHDHAAGHGGHAHGAHGGHGAAAAGTQAAQETDPVCGMKVSRSSEHKSVYAGKAYYFCSKEDKVKFDKNPESYLKKKS